MAWLKTATETFREIVKRLAKDGEDYYRKVGIVPDREDIISYVINAIEESRGVDMSSGEVADTWDHIEQILDMK
jgi:hypothetical protein